MGLFDFLFGGKNTKDEIFNDLIWLSAEEKFAGIAKQIRGNEQSGLAGVLLVAHFRDVFEELLPLKEIAGGRCCVSLCEDLKKDLLATWPLHEFSKLFVVVGERHLLPARDQQILDFAASLSCECEIQFCISLEDPLLEMFSGDWVKKMLEDLGMKKGEVIESRLVARRIKAAQQKIAGQFSGYDRDADSASQWLVENRVPGN